MVSFEIFGYFASITLSSFRKKHVKCVLQLHANKSTFTHLNKPDLCNIP